MKRTGNRKLHIPPVLQTLLLGCAIFLGATVPAALLMLYSDRLHGWWIVLTGIYYACYAFALAVILRKRELQYLRMQYGEEWLYENFPEVKRIEERKRARREQKARVSVKREDPWE